MRQPDSERGALGEIAARVLPGSGRPAVERTASGVSTPVYRIRRGGTTLYLRLAEGPEASLAPEALVHGLLRARRPGARGRPLRAVQPGRAALGDGDD